MSGGLQPWNRRIKGALAILVVANLLLWFDRAGLGRDGRFAADLLQVEAGGIPGLAGVQVRRFATNAFLPPIYAYLERDAEPAGFVSLYVGYYARQGLAEPDAHDPVLCYRASGWEVTAGPDQLRLRSVDGAVLGVQRLQVRLADKVREVVYWRQEPAGLPLWDLDGWERLRGLWRRYRTRRSDAAWVRVEWSPNSLAATSGQDLRRTLSEVVALVARCLD